MDDCEEFRVMKKSSKALEKTPPVIKNTLYKHICNNIYAKMLILLLCSKLCLHYIKMAHDLTCPHPLPVMSL